MRNKQLPRKHRKPAPAPEEAVTDRRAEKIVLRPDGFYWQAPERKQEFGPFETLELARAAPGETLQEAEDEIGIADWIDPETGAPAEGQSPPRLELE